MVACIFFHKWSERKYTKVFGGFYVKHCVKCREVDALPKVYKIFPEKAKTLLKERYFKELTD